MKTIKTLVVDDEPLARERIRDLLAHEADFEVIGECEYGEEAVGAALEARPDVIFLDVQMPGMNGFEVLDAIREECHAAIVFVTAFDEYAVRAFEESAVDYLLKPYDEKRFRAALERVRQRYAEGQTDTRVDALLRKVAPSEPTRLVVRVGSRYEFIPIESIDWLEAEHNYVRVHASGHPPRLMRATLSAVEMMLPAGAFTRVHRSVIVALSRIKSVEPHNRTEFMLTLADGTRIKSGRLYRNNIRTLIRTGELL
jgi:two-component system, LytTR family, response regulator